MGASASEWDLEVRLEGRLVRLDPLRAEDAPELFEVGRPLAIWEWWPFNPALDAEHFERWVGLCVKAAEEGERQHFTIRARDGDALGSTSFCTPRPEHRGIEIGWTWLTPSAWRTGANVEAKALMLAHAFEELGCQRVEFVIDAENKRSRGAVEALSATFEGIRRKDRVARARARREEPRSSAVYSLIDSEWPKAKRRLARRLERRLAGGRR